MTDIVGLAYVPLHWHFWIGLSIPILVISVVVTQKSLYHDTLGQLTLLFGSIIFGAVMYFLLGILFYQMGWM